MIGDLRCRHRLRRYLESVGQIVMMIRELREFSRTIDEIDCEIMLVWLPVNDRVAVLSQR